MLLTACADPPQTTPIPIQNPTSTVGIAATETYPPTIALPTQAFTPFPTSTPARTHSASATPTPLLDFKAMSYNILYGGGVDRVYDAGLPIALVGRNRLPELLSFIKRANPDILGIQEANGWHSGTPPVIQQVAMELGMNYYLASTPSGFDLGLLTRYQILETENLTSEIGRQGALRTKLLAPNGVTLYVFVAHLDPTSAGTRLCQVNALMRQMQPYAARETVLLADMNFNSASREYSSLAQAGWQSVAVEKSWGIDQIWMSPSARWSGTGWYDSLALPSEVSDHTPIGAEIKLLPGPASAAIMSNPTPPIPPPSIASDVLADLQVERSDSFDDPCAYIRWSSRWKTEKISNGRLEIGGEEPWQAFVSRFRQFTAGQGVITRFQFTGGSEFGIHFDNSAWNTDQYRRFGIAVRDQQIRPVTWQGQTEIRPAELSGNLDLVPDTWYNLLLALGKNGEMKVLVWDPSKPTGELQFREQMGEQWTTLPWILEIGVNNGKVTVDDFSEISFSAIK